MTDADEAAGAAAEHVAAAAMVETRPSRPAAIKPDTPEGACSNCAAELVGPVCHRCGQVDDRYHRPVLHLVREGLENLVALDGRFARTVPALLVFPGRVTRDFLSGKRARFIPPFRLYILASLLLFVLLPFMIGDFDISGGVPGSASMNRLQAEIDAAVARGEITQAEAAEARAALERLEPIVGGGGDDRTAPDADESAGDAEAEAARDPPPEDGPEPAADGVEASSSPGEVRQQIEDALSEAGSEGRIGVDVTPGEGGINEDSVRRQLVPEEFGEDTTGLVPRGFRAYLADQVTKVNEDPQDWLEESIAWIPRVMFVMVPVYALLLGLVYIWRRGFFFYDHLIVSLHFHAALFIAMVLGMAASTLIGGGWVMLALLIYSNLYLYKVMRAVYHRGRITSALRVLALDFFYMIVLMFALSLVFMLGIMTV